VGDQVYGFETTHAAGLVKQATKREQLEAKVLRKQEELREQEAQQAETGREAPRGSEEPEDEVSELKDLTWEELERYDTTPPGER